MSGLGSVSSEPKQDVFTSTKPPSVLTSSLNALFSFLSFFDLFFLHVFRSLNKAEDAQKQWWTQDV